MPNLNFSGASALLAHMLEGHKVSSFEAMVLFGVQDPRAEFRRIRSQGHLLKKERVSMAKILRRANQFSTVLPPENLPTQEISMIEYWISH